MLNILLSNKWNTMKLFRLVKVSILVICLCSCEKGNDEFNIDCGNLIAGIINMDSDAVRNEINKLTEDLNPTTTAVSYNCCKRNI